MGLLKKLFGGKPESTRPDDYGAIYVRWDKDGKEYGPLGLEDLITRQWSGPPRHVRFENESGWSKYDRFEKLLDRLEASDDQASKLGLEDGAPRPPFREAIKKIDELAEAERARKAALPATPHMRGKMDNLGISYPEDITREQAKQLVKEREAELAAEADLAQLRERGIDVADGVEGAEELLYTLDEMKEIGVSVEVPRVASTDELKKLNSRYSDALMEADNAECEIEERELLIGCDEYKLVGALPKKGLAAIKHEVFRRAIAGEWNQDAMILDLVREHMPKVKIRVVED